MGAIARGVMSLRRRFPTISAFRRLCCCGSSLRLYCCDISLSISPIGACVFGSFACGCCLVCARHGANGGFA